MFDWYCGRDFAPSSAVSKPDVMSYSLFVAASYSGHVLPFYDQSRTRLLFRRFPKQHSLFFCRSPHSLSPFPSISLFLPTPNRIVSPMCKKQLNDDGIIVIASIRKKDKLLFANSMPYFYCVFKSNEANDRANEKFSIMPQVFLYWHHFHYDIFNVFNSIVKEKYPYAKL